MPSDCRRNCATGSPVPWAGTTAIIGPTAWNLVHKLPPARWLAILCGLLFVIILLKIGEDANYEFIYFQS